jgi:hypothetical protein
MHFLFILLRIKSLYMFRALLVHLAGGNAQTTLGIARKTPSVCVQRLPKMSQ